MACLYSFLSLLGIALLALVRERRHLNWLSWFKAESESGSIARVGSFLRARFTLTPGR